MRMRTAASRFALPVFVAAACAAATPAVALPPGAAHLRQGSFKRVGPSIQCGFTGRRWQPGSRVLRFWFISHARQASNYRRYARHARGHARTVALRRAKNFARLARRQHRVCGPLRFGLHKAVGLALRPAARSRSLDPSNLDVITRRGKLREAVTSGSADVLKMFNAPNGKVYVLFKSPVPLGGTPNEDTSSDDPADARGGVAADDCTADDSCDDTSTDDCTADDSCDDTSTDDCTADDSCDSTTDDTYVPPVSCLLAEIAPATGEPTCVDSSLYAIRSSYPPGANPPIQFDDKGAIYYTGTSWGARTVLRRYLDGQAADYVNESVNLDDFLVLPSGDVLITGSTGPTKATWVRRVEPSGQVHTVRTLETGFLRTFPDGNVYMGLLGADNIGVRRLTTATGQVEQRYWIGAGDGADQDITALCKDADPALAEAFCQWSGARVTSMVSTANGRVYGLAGTGGTARLVQYWPELKVPDTQVRRVAVAQRIGDNLALAGLDADNHQVLVLHDTTTDAEGVLIKPEDELEIYHLAYNADTKTLLFDGLRFADNTYVVGQADLATGKVTMAASATQAWISVIPLD